MKLKAIFYLLMIIPYLVLNVVFLIMYSCSNSYKSFGSFDMYDACPPTIKYIKPWFTITAFENNSLKFDDSISSLSVGRFSKMLI